MSRTSLVALVLLVASCNPSRPPEESTCVWRPAAEMAEGRWHHSLARLPDGRVLASGGVNAQGASPSSTEVYDPQADSWRAGPSLDVPRDHHNSIATPDGRVLVVGGRPEATTPILLDLEASSAAPAGPILQIYRVQFLPLGDDRILVLGDAEAGMPSPRIFDSAADTWSELSPPPIPLASPRAALGTDGRVAVFAHRKTEPDPDGFCDQGRAPAAYWLDVERDTWTEIPSPGCYGASHHLLELSGDRVYLFGGSECDERSTCASSFDLVSENWSSEPDIEDYHGSGQFVQLGIGRGAVTDRSSLYLIQPDVGPPERRDLPLPSASIVALENGGVFAAGGGDDEATTSRVEICD